MISHSESNQVETEIRAALPWGRDT